MTCINLKDYEARARTLLPPEVYDYFAGGAQDEVTLRANRAAFEAMKLQPRVLRGGFRSGLETSVLGSDLAAPIVIAPTAFHRLAHPAGEVAVARAAVEAGLLMIVSMASTTPVEEITAVVPPAQRGERFWFQIYIQPDRAFTLALARRAQAAGCSALVVTADSPGFGRHERDLRHGFSDLPQGLHCAHMREAGTAAFRSIEFDRTLSWDDVEWLRASVDVPVVIKGITHPDDARLALAHGAGAVIVSNHGGRQLDSTAATLHVLPGIVEAVAGRIPVFLDGGVRRGTDAVKALALGARAVAIGRPVLWGLAVDGQAGVADVLSLLKDELLHALELCGCTDLDSLSTDVLFPSREWRQ